MHRLLLAVGAVDELAANLIEWREGQMIEVHKDQVGLLANFERADFRPTHPTRAIPYAIIMILFAMVLIVWPGIATWLPQLMRG